MAFPDDIARAAQILWDFHCVYDPVSASDAIIGLGSYDLRVAARCAELFHAGIAPHLVFTGASGHWTRDLYAGSEAAAFAEHAMAAGVPEAAIQLEETAGNIGENITLVARLIPNARQVVLVTKPQTQLRVRATADRQWPGVRALVTAPLTSLDEQPTEIHGKRDLCCEMVGDLQRLLTYPALGYQATVDIPDAVAGAYETLKAAGFTDHLLSGT